MAMLTDTQRIILSQASQRDDGLVVPPERLPAAARQTVAKALMKQGLVRDQHAGASAAREAWQIEGRTRLLRNTEDGLRAIGIEPEPTNAVDEAELGGLTAPEYEEEQALAQAALDAGMELSAGAAEVAHPSAVGDTDFQPDSALPLVAPQGDSQAAVLPPPLSAASETPEGPQRLPVTQRAGMGRVIALRAVAVRVVAA